MADIGGHPPPNEFQTRLTSPKNSEHVGMEMYNGGLLPFKAYPKAWDGSHRHGSSERCSMQIDIDDDEDNDDDLEDHMITKDDAASTCRPCH